MLEDPNAGTTGGDSTGDATSDPPVGSGGLKDAPPAEDVSGFQEPATSDPPVDSGDVLPKSDPPVGSGG